MRPERAGSFGRASEQALESRLGYQFKDPGLMKLALTHASALPTSQAGTGSYQRLEFVGDRVLGLVVARMLHDAFPKADEGELARRLNHLVKKETCAQVAVELNIGSALTISDSEEQTGGRKKTAILADVCEAVIAAIFLDGGYECARDVVETIWRPLMLNWNGPLRDAKTTLQEWAQGRGLAPPVYDVIKRGGPDHAPVFTVTVTVEGKPLATGHGGSKRIAEQSAASTALVEKGVWTETTSSD